MIPACICSDLYGRAADLSRCAFVVPTIHGTPTRIITTRPSSESCPSLCGCPILRRSCEGWVFSVLVLVSVSLLVPRFPSNPSTHPACTNLFHILIESVVLRAQLFVFRIENKSTPSHPSQNQRSMGHPQELRLNFGVIYPSGMILTEAPAIVETTDTKQRRMRHPPISLVTGAKKKAPSPVCR